jgi:hypothetical protein
MRPAVRLIRRPDGGFRIQGVAQTPIDAVPDRGGFLVTGSEAYRLSWSDSERGWLLNQVSSSQDEVGRTTSTGSERVASPASLLLADGRLFRLALIGASEPHFALGRWDVPGAYAQAWPANGSWDLTLTAAGQALSAPETLWILTCIEIARLDGWC